MNKTVRFLILVILLIVCVPSFAFAAWWNPWTWVKTVTPTTRQTTEVLPPPKATTTQAGVVSTSSVKVSPAPTPQNKPAVKLAILTNSQIINKVKPAVVYIETEDGSGSGMIVESNTAQSFVLTNAHVVSGINQADVTVSSGQVYKSAVVGRDEKTDIALLRIDQGSLPTVQLADSSKLAQGDNVSALGYPFGIKGDPSFTSGVVSRLLQGYIEMSVQIHPGHSGGPLINQYGQVVGINTMSYSSDQIKGVQVGESIKFAIPINTAKNLMVALKTGRNVVESTPSPQKTAEASKLVKEYCKDRATTARRESMSLSSSQSSENGMLLAHAEAELSEAEQERDGQISDIRSRFSGLIESTRASYSRMEATQQQMNIRSGTSRYAPTMATGNTAGVQNQGAQAISNLQNQEQMYISRIEATYQPIISKYESLIREISADVNRAKKDAEAKADVVEAQVYNNCLSGSGN